MRLFSLAASALAAGGLMFTLAGQAQAACKLQLVAELPVIMNGNQPLVEVSIDGHPVRLILDTGASKTLLTREGAQQLGLHLTQMSGVRLYGVGGSSGADMARVKDLKLGAGDIHDVDIMVLDRPLGDGLAGVLGQDVLLGNDLEIDLANKVVRLLAPKDCHDDQVVYWANSYSYASLGTRDEGITVNATLNGQSTSALLDTGATRSIVTLDAARAAGVTPEAVDVKAIGDEHGIGGAVEAWVGTFKTLAIGSEVVQNARLELSDLYSKGNEDVTGSHIRASVVDQQDMILGDDFIKAHRIYIAMHQGKMYFTYNGGGIFEPPAADDHAK